MYWRRAVFFAVIGAAFTTVISTHALADDLAAPARQLVVCLAPQTSSFEGSLQLFSRDAAGQWHADSSPWPVLFARGGLAWGRGINPPQPGPQKKSDDHRNPAGLFKIGYALGYAPTLPSGAHGWPYHQVTDRDAWIDLPELYNLGYNHLYTLPPGAPQPWWWDKEHLHVGDFAYEWMLLIEDNYDRPVINAGTSIFFHIRRGDHYRTAGCTTMARDNLIRMIKWLRPGSNAMLAELSRDDYLRLWRDWHLPPPEVALSAK
jgi:L,D-peptidoglycan transpeptidase YkuD (ErfK/YbiS/YcfS/YnhG family)